MGSPNYYDPQTLLAELKSRHAKGQSINDLLPCIAPLVEAMTQQRHPDYWVRERIVYWARYPAAIETDVKHWGITPERWAVVLTTLQKLQR